MENPNSYENVMRELEEINDLIENGEDLVEEEVDKPFKFEYAHENLTEKHSAYKRRNHDA